MLTSEEISGQFDVSHLFYHETLKDMVIYRTSIPHILATVIKIRENWYEWELRDGDRRFITRNMPTEEQIKSFSE